MLSPDQPPVRYVDVLDRRMAYLEMGEGKPIVFQHGNPTSSYLWRNVMPHVADLGRCVAIDLIGMGRSDPLPDSGPSRYTFEEQRRYFDAALDALGISADVTLVLHDWGSALGFDWANRHRDAVRGLCFMEAIVRPLVWDEWPAASRGLFQSLRSDAGDALILERNVFVERILPGSILRELGDEEMSVYRAPFAEPGERRRPTLSWPRQLPIDGEPADVVAIVQRYADWLSQCEVPKLFVNADPGAILVGPQRDFCRGWPALEEVTVPGSHFVQEDSPHEIGRALRAWIEKHGLTSTATAP